MFSFTKVAGEVMPGPEGLLTSPLTGVSCVWYKVKVESWQARADLHHRDTVFLSKTKHPFRVLDQSGPLLISADIIPPSFEATVTETVSMKRPPTRDQAPLLHSLADRGLIPQATLNRRAHLLDELIWETSETILLPGQRVHAHGRVGRYRGLPILRRSVLGFGFRAE
ncbi:MAG TPA: hypothetical protein DGT23_18180 [Micromonosporaceae bacterium]|nr:hypothetical protein [Micromonosporaceae bacterium]